MLKTKHSNTERPPAGQSQDQDGRIVPGNAALPDFDGLTGKQSFLMLLFGVAFLAMAGLVEWSADNRIVQFILIVQGVILCAYFVEERVRFLLWEDRTASLSTLQAMKVQQSAYCASLSSRSAEPTEP